MELLQGVEALNRMMQTPAQKDDRITRILKRGSTQTSMSQEIMDAANALGMSERPVMGAHVSFGKALSAIRANRIAEAEKIAKVEMEEERLDFQRHRAVAEDLFRGLTLKTQTDRLAETKRHNLAMEGKDKKGVFDRKVEALSETMPREVAVGIAAGRYMVARDLSGAPKAVVDLSNGKKIWDIGQTVPLENLTPPPASIPEKAEYPSATGAGGLLTDIANTIADAVGFGLVGPKTEEAAQAMTNLQVRTRFAARPTGWRPGQWLADQLDKLTVTPNSLGQGEERALIRFRQTRQYLVAEAARIERDVLGNTGAFNPSDVALARGNLSEIRGLIREYDIVIRAFTNLDKDAEDEPWKKYR